MDSEQNKMDVEIKEEHDEYSTFGKPNGNEMSDAVNQSEEQDEHSQCLKCLQFLPSSFSAIEQHMKTDCLALPVELENVSDSATSQAAEVFTSLTQWKEDDDSSPGKISQSDVPQITTLDAGDQPYSECGQTSAEARHMVGHMAAHADKRPYNHDNNHSETFKQPNDSIIKWLHAGETPDFCPQCDTKYTDEIHRRQHRCRTINSCPKCIITFASASLLRMHMKTHVHCCPQCNKTYATSHDLEMHMKVHTITDGLHTCSECSKTFVQRSYLTRHMKVHSMLSNRCSECDQAFTCATSLRTHMRTHKGIQTYSCLHCEKVFDSESTMKFHMMNHTGDNHNFPTCTECSKPFQTASQLKRHLITHSSERPYSCLQCNMTFKRPEALKVHGKTVHIICVKCDQAFTSCVALRYHMMNHTGDNSRNFPTCTECGKSFPTASELKRHMITHSNERPYSCPQCNMTFKRPEALKVHGKTVHGILIIAKQ